MSEVTSSLQTKMPAADGELVCENFGTLKNNETSPANSQESKLKRTFSFTRNALTATRASRRKNKSKDVENAKNSMLINDMDNLDNKYKKHLLRPSWNKFIKYVQKVSNLSLYNNKNLCSNYGCGGRPPMSLSSSDIRVPPVRPGNFPNDKVPGVIGLRNHGNTCFINAVLQCLSHTDILAEYFVLDQYKADLSRRNKINSKKHGTKGEVTQHLALLLKSIWSCQYDPEISNKFKLIVDKYGSQFRGNNQHDAQEFLLWLLDKVHEDLNTATKKKYKAIKNTYGRPDDVVARETLDNHIRQNESFVLRMFQAQFRSSLTCPRCHQQSNTFDPFLCVSVPVPQEQPRPLYATILYTSQQPRQVKLGLSLPSHAEIRDLKEQLALDTGISEKHMLITEIDDIGFQRTFSDNQPISMIKETDPIYCIELPELKEASQDTGEYILLVWINTLIIEDQCSRFSSPYTMQVCRETSYIDVEKLMLKEMCWSVADGVLEADTESLPGEVRMRIVAPGCGTAYLDPTLEHPLYDESVDNAIALCDTTSAPQHLKLVLEWDLRAKDSMVVDDADHVVEHSSVKLLKQNSELGGSVTLEECFQLYTKEEVLGAEDAWHCPSCNLKQEVVKKLGLWSLPDILVIHLKRFRQPPPKNPNRSTIKLTTLVDFPANGFDMSPHLCGSGNSNMWLKKGQGSQNNTYDLYAVCNHHGQNLHTGHYTAYCRNPYNGQWYCFDDTRVTSISESELVTTAAYILFYQRRGLLSPSTSSSASSTSEHWATRLVPVSRQEERFQRNSRQYATVPARQSAQDLNSQGNDRLDDETSNIEDKQNNEPVTMSPTDLTESVV
ncbi:ubiquitin carboxyl-terminal hydrolase 31 isoform X1 [Halyomorpha halys]|uniref:ubiquitin carboxyl-terminal hydrolase 31 isoform X1 n=1 Tax=Halyomorpha halys TaxID=286706 RepID=UPI0006D50EBE|nr:ubiquitin carboxyl-terminal hydrolase 31-like isoform X1 [Halyomorpha halys]